MKGRIINIWFSPVYHTRELCRLIGVSLRNSFPGSIMLDCDLTDFSAQASGLEINKEDIAVIAAPVYAGRIPEIFVKKITSIRGKGAPAILLASYGNRAYENALAELKARAEASGFLPVAACACIARHTIAKIYAQGRPDKSDREEVTAFAVKIAQKLQKDDKLGALHVPGEQPLSPGPVFPLPQTVNENCVQCGICQEKCPARAINLSDPSLVDPKKCICCMRCVALCPEGARIPDSGFIQTITQKLEPFCTEWKANQFYFCE